MPEYDIFQQAYQLSMASNMVRSLTGTPGELQSKLSEVLPGVMDQYAGPGWEVVWGPAVWKHEGATDEMPPDNVWFVAKNPSATFEDGSTAAAYVVAIAATAGDKVGESYDWTHENFGVNQVVDYQHWINGGITNPPTVWTPVIAPQKAFTAKGTTDAVHILATSPPVGATQPLLEFLRDVDAPAGSKLIFTGQSLGGALSPTLALTLKLAGYLDKFQPLVYGSAGASPGNGNFANLFAQNFPPIGDQSTHRFWNLNLVNMLDPVPNGWCRIADSPLRLGRIPDLYGKLSLLLGAQIVTGVNFLKDKAAKSMIKYTPLPNVTFPGIGPVQTPQTMDEFVAQCLLQHMSAYHQFVLGSADRIPLPLGGTTPEEDLRLSAPLLGCLDASLKGRVPEVPEVPDEEAGEE